MFAQDAVTVSGGVVDAETERPVADVSIFISGTTSGSSTDSSGAFSFLAARTGMVELVATAVGFQPHVVAVDLRLPEVDVPQIRLQPHAYELDEVSVEAERPRGWRRDFERFRDLFLGTSDHARETVITNPYVLDFRNERGFFTATSSQPLEIENRALGYRIRYVLGELREGRESTAQYSARYTMYYTGQAFFEEMEPRDPREAERWTRNRKQAFEGSLQHFLWALTRDRLTDENFDLRIGRESELGRIVYDQGGDAVEPAELLTPTDRPGHFVLKSEEPLVVMHRSSRSLNLFGIRIPVGTGSDVTTLKINTPAAVVHVTGYARSPLGPQNPLAVAGSMSRRRIADMLPRDYVRIWEENRPETKPTHRRAGEPGLVAGMVVDAEADRSVQGAVVTAIAADGTTTSVRTDGEGRFGPITAEEISVIAPGYLPTTIADSAATGKSIEIDLIPIDVALIAEQGFGSNLAFMSAAESGPRPTHRLGVAAEFVREREWRQAENALTELLKSDPDDVEARYYRAIAARERGKLHLPLQALMNNNAVDRSRADFEILARSHANYRDVLYQHALLEWYDGRYQRAVELAHAQVVLKPELTFARLGLHRLAESLLHHEETDAVRAFLAERKAPFFRYLAAESHRLAGRLDEADRALMAIPHDQQAMRTPVLLARARIAFARNEREQGQRFVEEAIKDIESPLDAWFLLEDYKYVLEPGELKQFALAASSEAHSRYFRGFWTKRDPDRTTPLNERLAEHYERLSVAERDYYFDGLRAEFNTPDVDVQAGELAPRIDFPDAYWLNHALDDRGLIYVRHGEPWDRAFDNEADRSNVSWRYYRNGRPVDFHFIVSDLAAHDNWRLVPTLPQNMKSRRAAWGFPYTGGWNPREVLHLHERNIAEGLTTDTHTWGEDVEPLFVPHRLAAFSGEDGRTLIRLYYTFPTEADRIGFSVHDRNWEEVFSEERRPRGALVFEAQVPPDSLHLSLVASSDDGKRVGSYRWSYAAPDFRGDSLLMSDVVPLHPVVSDTASNPARWGSPLTSFERSGSLPLYFEVYGLTFDGDDRTSYELEYRLEPVDRRGGLFGFLRGDDDPTLSLTTTLTGSDRNTAETTMLDISSVKPGNYELHVTVRDRTSGKSASGAIEVELR